MKAGKTGTKPRAAWNSKSGLQMCEKINAQQDYNKHAQALLMISKEGEA